MAGHNLMILSLVSLVAVQFLALAAPLRYRVCFTFPRCCGLVAGIWLFQLPKVSAKCPEELGS